MRLHGVEMTESKRIQLPSRVREQVLWENRILSSDRSEVVGYLCNYCLSNTRRDRIQVDHVRPTWLGGTNVPENLVTCCASCNIHKSRQLYFEYVKPGGWYTES